MVDVHLLQRTERNKLVFIAGYWNWFVFQTNLFCMRELSLCWFLHFFSGQLNNNEAYPKWISLVVAFSESDDLVYVSNLAEDSESSTFGVTA